MREPWRPGETPEEETARREAYRRLADAARRVGLPLERLARLLEGLAHNEEETRRFLASSVYGVSDDSLDALLRERLERLEEEE